MYCWSIEVAIKINGDKKCVLKLCMHKIPSYKSGHMILYIIIIIMSYPNAENKDPMTLITHSHIMINLIKFKAISMKMICRRFTAAGRIRVSKISAK